MISFQKEDVEYNALQRLKRYDKQKYKDAYISEMPDIQNDIENVGVEVVVVDFKENFFVSQLMGKPFLNFLRMTNCFKLQKKDLEHKLEYPEGHPVIEDFLASKPAYIKEGKAQIANHISEIRELKPKEEIFLTTYSHYQFQLDKHGKIKFIIPPAQWVGKLPKMMIEAVEIKERKAADYKIFAEMNLYLHSFTSDLEEIQEFEKILKDNHRKQPYIFQNFYLPIFWGAERELYQITLD